MKVLITAGSTNVMIDKVRCISNIFKGRTGSEIARNFFYSAHDVTLITSNPNHHLITNVKGLNVLSYKTYDELYSLMEQEITTANYDVVIHSAAVSDYKVEGTYTINDFGNGLELTKMNPIAKIPSTETNLYLKLVQTEKIVDKIRDPWGFNGILVKFKLQVGMTNEELINIAHKSRKASKADFIVANCLEWSKDRAYILSDDSIVDTDRNQLSNMLLAAISHKKYVDIAYKAH